MRDALLGITAWDLDFAVEGDAAETARLLHRQSGGRLTIHPDFGTATVATADLRVDFATARSESYSRPGALPKVTPASIEKDLGRRDFTINAMALPLAPSGSSLLDPAGGLADLDAGVVRTLHPGSFTDDPTRMMRAVRYEQRFGFRIDGDSLAAISSAVSTGSMDAVSGDRWRNELERMLEEPDPAGPLLRAAELGLMGGIHPSWKKLNLSGPLAYGREWLEANHYAPASYPQLCFAALFGQLSSAEAEGVINRLRISGRCAATARDTIALRDSEPEIRAVSERPAQLARLLRGRETAAISAWATLSSDDKVAGALRCFVSDLRHVKAEVNGSILMEMGAPQGPLVGEILARLRDARLDGAVKNAEEEMALARRLLKSEAGGSLP